MKLRLVQIDRWWFIKHGPRHKFFKFKYWQEDDARADLLNLEEEWRRTPGLEDRQVTDDFNVGHGKSEPAPMKAGR